MVNFLHFKTKFLKKIYETKWNSILIHFNSDIKCHILQKNSLGRHNSKNSRSFSKTELN